MQCPGCYAQMNLVEVGSGKFDNGEPMRIEVYQCEECGFEDIFYDDEVNDDDDYDPALIENPPLFCDWGDGDDEGLPHRHESED